MADDRRLDLLDDLAGDGETSASPTRGLYSVPPLASAAYAWASWSGVTITSPWPMAAITASPGCQWQPSWQSSYSIC